MKHEDISAFAETTLAACQNADASSFSPVGYGDSAPSDGISLSILLAAKRIFDVVFAICLMPVLLLTVVVLLVANRFQNPGRMFYVQPRMDRDCKPFNAIKLRTMRCADVIERTASCPLEEDRITPLGKLLRKTRFDELPQIFNVLRGDMSLVGPRPDYFEHACHFVEHIPGYRERHAVRPGISGLAQTEVGYAAGIEATRKKVSADLYYIQNRSFRLEAWIFMRTIAVIIGKAGS